MATKTTEDELLRTALIVLGVIVLIPVLLMAFAVPMMGMMGWWGGGMFGRGVSPVWGFGMMFVWLLVLLGISYALYRGLVGRSDSARTNDPALDELRTAFARGEISEEEFEMRREKLRTDR
ncbi:SHOCT domain-containing protein [Haladaptatus cibarius]|uniref:SHOCT domain-containing protein n=1 Tax=Haladaptatus cibarius TaxID=453847 RepID=UPI0006796851|nr:SHOCT domain-containing protein [Haladaptatus cibarius]